ncbi:MAG: DDE-type integrase/transposase/recombinase [Candidatus Theseobacter exili]|nr:DDE-type integrase/transposase/recombinase [Candidatus Theseobacter exili]
MAELPIKKEDAVAFFRFQIISEMLDAQKGFVESTAKKIAKDQFNDVVNKQIVTFSERTIWRYYSDYKKHGFDGLKPKLRSDKGTHPGISNNTIHDILALKKELPLRSAAKIIIMLTLANRIEENALHIRTVNRILYQYGYTRESLLKNKRIYVKHEKDRICDMWQSDVMSAFYIPDGNNGSKLAYLIGIVDDHSRRDMHSEFYLDSTLTRLEDTLRKAVIKFGSPVSLYVDNGKIYVSEQFRLICARLGIKIRYSTPFHPAGKGKIERYWHNVQESFIPEMKKQKVKSLSELNDLYFAWKKAEYDNKLHSSVGMTPVERWNMSITAGTKLKFFSPVELEEVFLHAERRVVNKYGVVSFEGNTYEAPAELIGKVVIIRFNPFHLNYLHVYFNDKYFGTAKIIDLKTKRHKSVGSIPEESGYDSEISHMYLENIKSNYQKYLKDQLTMSINKNLAGENEPEVINPDNHPMRPPKEIEITITRNEFIDIVKTSIGMTELTFQEKGKLHDLWNTFKEFNKDILVSILSDISQKTNDFNRNFLYYIAQLRTRYIEKLSELEAHIDE